MFCELTGSATSTALLAGKFITRLALSVQLFNNPNKR